ncbi:hypothetical protein PIB30_037992 [Stylosanthes scabra]|uniref:HD domain-containing protein n=1 Tax=Stylosanthes scabra TaxID=79078 RepID=A0ABU6ZCN0_9FABA|nr:hypothetical protein [Stylosanthes scabra]
MANPLAYSTDSIQRKDLKLVRDNVHGNIFLEPIFLKFVDTEQFQRLRDLKQLGLSHMVYPGAVHTRFEHSLGVYWLADKAMDILKRHQGAELGIERSDVLTVKLAGLLHDVGHGPFSHAFEHGFLPLVLNGATWNHEEMSVKMVDHIVDQHNIDIDPELLKKAKEMITSSSVHPPQKIKEKQFLYDIVANGRNGIDVDKFDYIVRDSRACGLGRNFQPDRLMETMQVLDNEICYRSQDYLTIHKLFATRADLHRTVYTHPKVKASDFPKFCYAKAKLQVFSAFHLRKHLAFLCQAIELMVMDALVKANPYLNIVSSIHQPSDFWKLDDSILKTIESSTSPELQESRDLVQRIRRRKLYQSGGANLKEEDVAVSVVKIDLTRGSENPLERIKFFKDYESKEKLTITNDRISHLLPVFYQDTIVRVYSKKPELVDAVADAFENYQLKKFGKTAQVHGTPKKPRRA